MKIALYSDLHLEMTLRPKGTPAWEPPALDVDVVILAGDIDTHTHGIEWAAKAFRQCPVSPDIVYVAGNHEYYDANLNNLTAEMRKTAARLGVHFLENNVIEFGGVRFLGSTLWSDFQFYGSDGSADSIRAARSRISGYSAIFDTERKFIEPRDTIQLYQKAHAFLEHGLARPFDGKTVVVTHFAPHRGCVEARFEGGELTPYFTVDMAPLMLKHPIDVWTFGHTHCNVDFVDHGCRVVSNQRGYPREQSPGFQDNLIIEI